ncbi:MAG: tetratricopeptide repeat protein [bacterium]|nr:tetratricopeptide repeat protein [bacterium]
MAELEYQDFSSLLEKGHEAIRSEQYEEAVSAYKETIRLKPDCAEAHLGLGVCYGKLNRLEESMIACKEAVRLEPENAEAHFYLGVPYAKLGRNEEAIRPLMMAIRLEPDLAEAHFWLGLSYGSLGRYKEAARAHRKAIHLEPDNADAHFYLGVAYLGTNNLYDAEEQYQILEGLDRELANKLLNLIDKTLESVETGETSFTNAIIKQCPYCGYKASVKHFGTWEKGGERGLLGKTPEGFIMFLCPQCKNHIKYDPVSDEFS